MDSNSNYCNQCHQSKPAHITSFQSANPEFPEDEAAILLARVYRLEEERIILQRRLNTLRSLTRNIPDETLSLIFQHACPIPPCLREDTDELPPQNTREITFHLELASVSSRWRKVVLSTPCLWTTIFINEVKPLSMPKRTVFLQTSFARSGILPLRLGLIAPISWITCSCILSPEIDEVLLENCHRISTLRLQGHVPPMWFWRVLPKLRKLNHLLFFSSQVDPPALKLPSTAPLTHFYINYPPYQSINLSIFAASLTSICLSDVPVDACLSTLLRCPGLVNYECIDPIEPEEEYDDQLNSATPIVFNKLELINWCFLGVASLEWDLNFLHHLSFPRLKTLRWSEGFEADPHPHHAASASFLNRLPLSLESLELAFVNVLSFSRCNLIENIPPNTRLKTITLKECSESTVHAVIRNLRTRGGQSRAFPSLECIHLKWVMDDVHSEVERQTDESMYVGQEFGLELAGALEERRDQTSHFTLKVEHVEYLGFSRKVMGRLRNLIKGGLDLKIFMGESLVLGKR